MYRRPSKIPKQIPKQLCLPNIFPQCHLVYHSSNRYNQICKARAIGVELTVEKSVPRRCVSINKGPDSTSPHPLNCRRMRNRQTYQSSFPCGCGPKKKCHSASRLTCLNKSRRNSSKVKSSRTYLWSPFFFGVVSNNGDICRKLTIFLFSGCESIEIKECSIYEEGYCLSVYPIWKSSIIPTESTIHNVSLFCLLPSSHARKQKSWKYESSITGYRQKNRTSFESTAEKVASSLPNVISNSTHIESE